MENRNWFPYQLASSEKQDHCYLKHLICLNTELCYVVYTNNVSSQN